MKKILVYWIFSLVLSVGALFSQNLQEEEGSQEGGGLTRLKEDESGSRVSGEVGRLNRPAAPAPLNIPKKARIKRSIRILLDAIAMKDLNQLSREIKVYPNGAIFRNERKPFDFDLVEFTVPDDQPVTIQKNLYAGKILFHKIGDDKVEVINEVDIENYIKGVMAAEIPSSWEEQALMAQAIVSRTYAYFRLLKPASSYYDVLSTVHHQVFYGRNLIKPSIVSAVDKTAGVVFTYKSKIVEPFFSANAGGYTEIPSNVWGSSSGDYGYLQSIESPFDEDMNGYLWQQRYRLLDIQRMLGLKKAIESVDVVDYTSSRRVANIEVALKDGGKIRYRGNEFRQKMGFSNIRSLLFSLERVGDMYFFSGRGYGHGVGMSQEGANRQAKEGRSVKDILTYYYKDVKFMRVLEPK